MAQPVRTIISLVICLALTDPLLGQAIPDTTTTRQALYAGLGGFASSASQTPFWFRSRQYGTVPLSGPAGIARLGVVRHLGDYQNPKKISVKLAAEGVANLGTTSLLILPVAYASLRFGQFEFYGGRRREVFGLVDTLLTSGSFSWSGNALPIPKIQIGTRGFAPLHFTKDFIAINAIYAHGWFGNQDSTKGSYLHQKAFYVRLGKPKGRINAFAGVLHYAQWGGRSAFVPQNLSQDGNFPSSWRAYYYVVTAAQTQDDGSGQFSQFDLLNRVGNQLGTIDFGLSIKLNKSSLFAYIQHPYEDKSGVAFKNLPDGLYGLRWRNEILNSNTTFQIQQVTAELLSTLNQSGFEIKTGNRQYDGADDYFNHGQYKDGWTYDNRVIGTPLLTRWLDTKPELADLIGGIEGFPKATLSNTRVNMLYVALLGQFSNGIVLKTNFNRSINFGRPIRQDIRMPVLQFSGLITIEKSIRWLGNTRISFSVSIDKGELISNNIGGWFKLSKDITKKN